MPSTGTQLVFLAGSISPPIGLTPAALFAALIVLRRDLRREASSDVVEPRVTLLETGEKADAPE